jgi:hypothetical protein
MALPPCVLWIDPGGITGLAWLDTPIVRAGPLKIPQPEPVPHTYKCMEEKPQKAVAAIEALLGWYGALAWVGWEQTTIMPRSPKDIATAIEVTGAARYLAGKYGCRILTPRQQHTPNAAEQRWLKAIGWWVPGKDDIQSAACHLMRWCQETGNVPSHLAVRLGEARSAN